MKLLQVLVALAILSGSLISISTSSAKPAYATKEGKKCAYCHVAAGKADLNDTGKCYKANDHSLAKCSAPAAN
jgi:hypothetical protein